MKTTKKIIQDANSALFYLKSPIYSRIKPNAWMISAFSVINPFTIDGDEYKKQFRQISLKLMSSIEDKENYEKFVESVSENVKRRIKINSGKDDRLFLSKFIKQISLESFLKSILNVNVDENLIEKLPDLIIEIWSRKNDQNCHDDLKNLLDANRQSFDESDSWRMIQSVIECFVPENMSEQSKNPLNIIIAGWETMWRLIFYCLLEISRREDIRQQLSSTATSPQHEPLLKSILQETLRLYPPTKSIHRINIETGELISIDIKSIHRNTEIWGADALTFRPDRFLKPISAKQKQFYLPFAKTCPAQSRFAYDFSAAVIVNILKHFPNFKLSEEFPDDRILDFGRNDFEHLFVKCSP